MKDFQVFCGNCKITYVHPQEYQPGVCKACNSSWIAVRDLSDFSCTTCRMTYFNTSAGHTKSHLDQGHLLTDAEGFPLKFG